ncbi:hypothetical protein AAVH_01205 [Aphelenchoides avenae]|nr:hypothetical protein AAVH_01205 [Aphelenchus avenae]
MSSSTRPTVDSDVLKLVFRNALAQKDVRKSPETLIFKLATTSKIALDAIARVLSQFREATLYTDEINNIDEEEPAIIITPPLFVWMVQRDMFHVRSLFIWSRDVDEWREFIQLFEMPSLRVLDLYATEGSCVDLAADIVRLNTSSIKVLSYVPVWNLLEPLPNLHLEKFVYTPSIWSDEGLNNLSHCVINLLEVELDFCCPDEPIPLGLFADTKAEEICFSMAFSGPGTGHFSAPEETTNEHVRRITIELKETSVDVHDIEALHRFFPKLSCIKLNINLNNSRKRRSLLLLPTLQEIDEYLTSSPAMPALQGRVCLVFTENPRTIHAWNAQNVSDQYDRLLKIRDAIALVPRQLGVCAESTSKFSRIGLAQVLNCTDCLRK